MRTYINEIRFFFFPFFFPFLYLSDRGGGANIVKDKANHAVILDKPTYDKLNKDVQTYRLITVAVLVDRLKINGSLARKALKELEEKGVIKQVVGHSKCTIYSTFFFFRVLFLPSTIRRFPFTREGCIPHGICLLIPQLLYSSCGCCC